MARTFFYIKNMNEIKTFKILHNYHGFKSKMLMHVCDGINPAKITNSDGTVTQAYYITWHLDKKHPTKQLCYFTLQDPSENAVVWFEKTNRWYHLDDPKEFEKLHNDIEVACVMANLED